MIDFVRAQLTHFTIHNVGNKGLGENLLLSEQQIDFKDDFVKETMLSYLLSPFKTDIYYQFKGKADVSLQSIQNVCEDLFSGAVKSLFLEFSNTAAAHLYNQSMHPKIKGGQFYVAYFKDVVCDGDLVDAVGFFKTEKQETFLKVEPSINGSEVETDTGINVNKLDKGCIVFNTDKKTGYKISVIDTNKQGAECSMYWIEDFLNAKIKPNAYYHTKNFIDATIGFCEEILTEANNVQKADQQMVLNKSVNYIANQDKFNLKDFEREVLADDDLIERFEDYRAEYKKRLDLQSLEDEFDVSATAIKQNKKYQRTIIKLDKNFHLYIHARHDYVEKGYDEEKGLKYYKLYFVNEE